MLKKIALWSLYAALVALLLAGAVYRTSVKLGDGEQEQSHESGSQSQSNGQNGNGQNAVDPVTGTTAAAVEEHTSETIKELVMMDGQVLSVSNRGLSIQLSDGQMSEIVGRAWRYAQGLGFSAQAGDPLWLNGFVENGVFEVVSITNLNTGQSVTLRDETGHPLWNGN